MALVTSVAASRANTWSFSPQSIPGLALWLDGADTTTITGTSPVTAWRDKSGKGNNASRISGATPSISNINGVPAIVPNGGLTGSITNTTATLTCFAVAVFDSASYGGLVSLGGAGYNDFNSSSGCSVFNRTGSEASSIYGTRNGTSLPSLAVTGGAVFLIDVVYDNTNANMFLYQNSGTSTSTVASNSGNFGYDTYDIGQRLLNPTTTAYPWYGAIGEIIIYNAALSTAQRNQVEGYLASKWGLHGQLPASHPYSSKVPFLPTQISGCQLWLDAADFSSFVFSSGTTVSAWNDKSGNGLVFAQPTAGNRPTYSSNGFNGGYPGISNGLLVSTTNIAINPTFFANGTDTTAFAVVNRAPPGPKYPRLFTASDYNDYAFMDPFNDATNGYVGLGDWTNNLNITSSVYGPKVYSMWRSSSSMFLNSFETGGLQSYSRTGVNRTASTTAQVFCIGGDTSGASDAYYGSFISEVIIFNNALSTAQRNQVEQYLGQKWAISAFNQPSPGGYLIPYNRPFYPVDIPGCQLWLDAADTTTITGTSPVTAWADKSGTGNNMTITGGNVSYSTNPLALSFNQQVTCTSALSTNVITAGSSRIFIVTQCTGLVRGTFAHVFTFPGIVETTFNTYNPCIRFQDNTTQLRINTETDIGANYFVNGTLGVPSGTSIFIPTGFNVIDGISSVSGTTSFALSSVPGNPLGDRYFIGYIQEVIVYSGPITTVQQQQVEQYLAQKWGLVAKLPAGHPGNLLPAFSTKFTVKSISGCQLWLDAADSSTITGTSSVTAWRDKSGVGNNMTLSSGTVSYTSNPSSVAFASGGMLVTTTYINVTRNTTAFIVVNVTSIQSGTSFGDVLEFRDLLDGPGYFSIRFYPNPTSLDNATVNDFTGGSPNGYYVNGTLYTSTQITVPSTYNLIVGTNTSQSGNTRVSLSTDFLTRYLIGNVQEVIIYTSAITTQQRQQVEGYLAWKWGLQSSLPSTHAYAKFAP